MADVYDNLHYSHEQLQARALEGSQQACEPFPDECKRSHIIELGRELDLKLPSRSCIIDLSSRHDSPVNYRSHRSTTETRGCLESQEATAPSVDKGEASPMISEMQDAVGCTTKRLAVSSRHDAVGCATKRLAVSSSLPATVVHSPTSPIPTAHFSRKYVKPGKSVTSLILRPHKIIQEFIAIRKARRYRRKSCVADNRQTVLKALLESSTYDFAMTCTIAFNIVLLIMETDKNASCYTESAGCAPAWMVTTNVILLAVYTIEMFVVIDVYRWGICRRAARLLEAFIVVFGYADLILTHGLGTAILNVQALKLVRLMRLIRGVRLLRFCPELHFIVLGFAGAMRTMFWGFCTLMLLMIIMALVAVEVINPLNQRIFHDNEACAESFESVWNTVLMFFQTLAAGDSWGSCAVPIIKEFPASFLLFAGALICVQVGFLNLIMSVTLDRVAEARERNVSYRLHEKQKEINESRRKWFKLFEELDTDGSGELSLEEVVRGFDSLPDFHADLKLLGIEREDLPQLLHLMDEDGNNLLNIDELLCTFDMITHFDTKMHQITMGMQQRLIGQRLEAMIATLRNEFAALLASDYSSHVNGTLANGLGN